MPPAETWKNEARQAIAAGPYSLVNRRGTGTHFHVRHRVSDKHRDDLIVQQMMLI